jgi:hypothetical protein
MTPEKSLYWPARENCTSINDTKLARAPRLPILRALVVPRRQVSGRASQSANLLFGQFLLKLTVGFDTKAIQSLSGISTQDQPTVKTPQTYFQRFTAL